MSQETLKLPVAAGVTGRSAAACRSLCDASEEVLWTAWEDTQTEGQGSDGEDSSEIYLFSALHKICWSHRYFLFSALTQYQNYTNNSNNTKSMFFQNLNDPL